MEAATPDSDEQFAEWYVWAKREVSSEGRVCLGVAQAAIDAMTSGADRPAAELVARASVAGTGVALLAKVSPWRRGYAQWYDWAREEFGGDPARLHRLTRTAIQRLKADGDVEQAAEAARAAAAADAPPGGPGLGSQMGPGVSWAAGGWDRSPSSPPAFGPFPGVGGPPPVPGSQRARFGSTPPRPVSFSPAAYAGFGRRLGATAIDLVLGLLGAALVVVIGGVLWFIAVISTREASPEQVALTELALLVILTLLFWLYDAGLESSPAQATLGKRALGLIVIDTYGRPISFGRATGRHFVKFVPLALCVGPLFISIQFLITGLVSPVTLAIGLVGVIFLVCLVIELLMILWTRHKQGLHDLISGSLVVRRQLLSQAVPSTTPPAPPAVPEARAGAPAGVVGPGEPVSPGR